MLYYFNLFFRPHTLVFSPSLSYKYFSEMHNKKQDSFFVDRELSWLDFNTRVLQEAADPTVPLMERIKFLGIFSNNLDEFFRVRVATLKRLVKLRRKNKIDFGFDPKKGLKQIHNIVVEQQGEFEAIFQNINKELAKNNLYLINERQLTDNQGVIVKNYFNEIVRPLLVPLMINEMTAFPELKDGLIYLAIKLAHHNSNKKTQYALIELPTHKISRFFVFERSDNRTYIMLLDDVVRYALGDIFGMFGYDQFGAYTIKITKDAEMEYDILSKNMLELISTSLKQRKFGQPVRLVYDSEIDPEMLNFLIDELSLNTTEDSVIAGGRYHNFKDFMDFPRIGTPEMNPQPFIPLQHPDIDHKKSIFQAIKQKDIFLHFPYQSFLPIIDFLREAAIDPQVVYIKAVLYRLAKNSNIINALLNAKANGKNVTAVIELQARFDEEANIEWTKQLSEAGITVIHGHKNRKVHTKLLLIGRREGEDIVKYANVSTGNFHESTAKMYADDSLLTANPKITQDIAKVFQYLETGQIRRFANIFVAPWQISQKFGELIEQEIANKKLGKPAYIIAKMNSLSDEQMIRRLYRASRAGVEIKLIVRGICRLIPGVKNLSENIEVISVVDRFLEHSRLFLFANGGEEACYISSADWMERNLHRRIEVACPIYNEDLKQDIKTILDYQLRDNCKARWVNRRKLHNVHKSDVQPVFRSQEKIYEYFKGKLNPNTPIYRILDETKMQKEQG